MKVYDFTVKDMTGKDQNLGQYKGKVLLIINSATECGFTPQYEDLQKIYDFYRAEGLEILDFPCDQFGHQAPGTNQEIATFCTARFGVTFPQFAKIDVNGKNETPLFSYLKEEQGFKGFDPKSPRGKFMAQMLQKIDADYMNKSDIKWNFTKFLINRKGHVVNRFEPTDDMAKVEKEIAATLKE